MTRIWILKMFGALVIVAVAIFAYCLIRGASAMERIIAAEKASDK